MVILLLSQNGRSQSDDAKRFGLPRGVHPHLNSMLDENDEDEQTLNTEIKNIGKQIKSTVKTVTAKRSVSCFGDPCNIKIFPLLYQRRYSGFWGGFRSKFTNDFRTDPYLYALDINLQRSDARESEIGFALDVPRLLKIAYQPRFKLEFLALDTTEMRYFGRGDRGAFYEKNHDFINQTRFQTEQVNLESLLAFRIAVLGDQTYSLFGGFHMISLRTDRFHSLADNQLYADQPLGYRGGVGGSWTLGLVADSRDSEFMARQGWMFEGGVSLGGAPVGNYRFWRIFFNDKRFFTYKRSTIAHRLTFDVLSGNVPFWEFKRVAGTQPIADISASDILRSYYRGRFHEPIKIVESLEWRYHAGRIWLFGLRPDLITVPVAVDFGKLGDVNAWSVSTGAYFAFTKSFLAQVFTGYAPSGWDLSLLFGVNI